MDLEKVNWIFNAMSNRKFLLCYNGHISQELVKSLLSVAEKKLHSEEMDLMVKKKVFNVMMECLQSVCKGENENAENSFFMLGKSDLSYDIYACFYVSENYFKTLVSFIDEVNSWDTEKLKSQHKNYILDRENNYTEKSLLPFIDISLKSKNKLQYEFEEIAGKYFFTVKTSVHHKLN
jgi:hypothetical protein